MRAASDAIEKYGDMPVQISLEITEDSPRALNLPLYKEGVWAETQSERLEMSVVEAGHYSYLPVASATIVRPRAFSIRSFPLLEEAEKILPDADREIDGWTPCNVSMPDSKKRVIFTNNVRALDAEGNRSHVWIGRIERSHGDPSLGQYTGTCESTMYKIHNVSHWKRIA